MSGEQFRVVATNSVSSTTSGAVTLTVDPQPVAPNITTQPGNQTVMAGDGVMFIAAASGIPTPALQWQASVDGGSNWANLTDGGNISGSTTGTLALENTTAVMNGEQFRAVASNAQGAATSNVVTLTVDFAPGITTQPGNQTVLAGASANFAAAASGNPAAATQWQISTNEGADWSNLTDGGNISGSTTGMLTVSNTTTTESGNQFRLLASNSVASMASGAAMLTVNTVPEITTPVGNQTVISGNTATFTSAASGVPTPTLQWQRMAAGNTTPVNLTDGGSYNGTTTGTLTVSNTTVAMSGDQFQLVATNTAGTATSNAAVLRVNPATTPPAITGQPADEFVLSGEPAAFTVTATGTGPLTYQWRFNGKNLTGNATAATYKIAKAAAANVGNYDVVVSGEVGPAAVSRKAVLALGVAPKVTTSPASVTVTAGGKASFTVAATGTPTPTLQWQISTNNGTNWSNITNGGNFSGATGVTLSVSNTTGSESGNQYHAVAINAVGTATSKAATLTVNVPPAITSVSGNQTVTVGKSATFSVTATGTGLKYQWQLNGKNITGATSATYTIAKVALTNAGTYDVVVSNAQGSKTSANITLTVQSPPTITTQPKAATAKAGTMATFTVVASGPSNSGALSYQWTFNGKNITNGGQFSGATGVTLTITSVTKANAGPYLVNVKNNVGTTPSASVKLTVK